jgi:hypothetical protein
MSVLSLTILNRMRHKTLESFKSHLEGNMSKMVMDNMYTLIYISFILLVTTIPAVLIAVHCNKTHPISYGILAFLVSDIYLLQWSIKKFIIKYPNYCPL